MSQTSILYLKALHLIGMVTWFAGLFYLVRLFVYHSEASRSEEPKKSILSEQYSLMEWRLYYIITWPGMVITLLMGFGLLYFTSYHLQSPWIHIKLVMILMLMLYHLYCGRIMRQLKAGNCPLNSIQFRLLNEAPTLLLVGIIFLAVFKNATHFLWGMAGLILLGIALMAGIRLYKKLRKDS